MKTLGFHRGVYVEGLRRLSTLGWLSLILTAVFSSLPHLLDILQNGVFDTHAYIEYAPEFFNNAASIFPVLYALPFVLPTVFTARLFAFQNSRRDSDFYHSLPVTRSTLHLSLLAAVATWSAVVVVGSSLVVFPLGILANGPLASDTVLAVASAIVSCLFVASVVFLGYMLSGNTMSALFASAVLLFVPTVISSALASVMAYNIRIIRMERLQLNNYQLLYGMHESVAAWVVTVLVTLLCLGLGFLVGAKRPSETAGQPSITPKLQHLFRLLTAFTVCLLPITELYEVCNGARFGYYVISELVTYYLIALAVYFLFELITTRKPKNLLKTVPWLGVLAAMNVVCVLGMCATTTVLNAVDKNVVGEQMQWVEMVEPIDYWSYEKQADGSVNTQYRPHGDSVDPFTRFCDAYKDSACDTVKLDSTKACHVAEQAFERTMNYRDMDDEYVDEVSDMASKSQKQSGYIYQVELRVKVGFLTRNRLVYLYDEEMDSLIKHIDNVMSVPLIDTLSWENGI